MNLIPQGVSSVSFKVVGDCARGGITRSLVAASRVPVLLQAQLFDDPPGHFANRLKAHPAAPLSFLLHPRRLQRLQKTFALIGSVGTLGGFHVQPD